MYAYVCTYIYIYWRYISPPNFLHPSIGFFMMFFMMYFLMVLENLELSLISLFATNQWLHSGNSISQCLLSPTQPFKLTKLLLLFQFLDSHPQRSTLLCYSLIMYEYSINTSTTSSPLPNSLHALLLSYSSCCALLTCFQCLCTAFRIKSGFQNSISLDPSLHAEQYKKRNQSLQVQFPHSRSLCFLKRPLNSPAIECFLREEEVWHWKWSQSVTNQRGSDLDSKEICSGYQLHKEMKADS